MFGWGALFKVLIENNRDDFGWNQNRRTQAIRAVVFEGIGNIRATDRRACQSAPAIDAPGLNSALRLDE